ncbi:MAG: hypothetical protein AB7V46_24880, partial [Thermomicrobiales bacterium]
MDPVRLAIVGCGGMGRRHLAGLGELRKIGDRSIELVADCDLNTQNASDHADEAASLLGAKPRVIDDLGLKISDTDELESADSTTDTGTHHRV